MKFQVTKRPAGKKSETRRIRREGNIPAVLYSKGDKGLELIIEGIPFKKLLDTIESGTLSSKKITLEIDGKEVPALVKDIQYHPTTYQILHLDFEELHDDIDVTLNIPLKMAGAVDCAGVKLGGVLRQVIRTVKVRCKPRDIPSRFDLDVKQLGLGQSLKLSSLSIPPGVEPRCSLKEVAVVVSRR